MRIAISNIAWPAEREAEMRDLLAARGIDAVDVAPGRYFPDVAQATAQDIAGVRAWWAERGIEITGMQALLFGTSGLNLFGAPAVQQAMLDHLGHVCRIGAGLGATRLVFGSPGNRNREGLEDAAAAETAAGFFRRLGALAAGHGVVVCLEPNPPCYRCNFMTGTDEAAAIVRLVDHPAIRLQIDSGAMTINGEDPAAMLAAHGALVGHIHASEPDLVPLGSGGTGHAAVAAAVRRHCPGHVVTIEMLPAKSGFAAADVAAALTAAMAAYGENAPS